MRLCTVLAPTGFAFFTLQRKRFTKSSEWFSVDTCPLLSSSMLVDIGWHQLPVSFFHQTIVGGIPMIDLGKLNLCLDDPCKAASYERKQQWLVFEKMIVHWWLICTIRMLPATSCDLCVIRILVVNAGCHLVLLLSRFCASVIDA